MKKIWCQIEAYPKYWPERLAFILYLTGVMIISCFHEPWFDEAVAWDIARDTSIKDILFYVPHYEGHPQLWHLVLAPFAKLGAPYEISLTFVNLLFAGTAVMLLLRFAPFPRLVKLLVPFTYFFFYQHGVIARPYSMAALAFVLLALCYGKRNIHPGYFVLSLMLLCSATAYGIVLAGGISIVWLLEIWNKENIRTFLSRFIKDKRFFWMLLLLVYALLMIYFLLPYSDTYAWKITVTDTSQNTPASHLLYMLVMVWSDVLFTSILPISVSVSSIHFTAFSLCKGLIMGFTVLSLILYFSYKKRTTALFILPAILYTVFSSCVYSFNHHTEMALLFLVFWFWCSCGETSRTDDWLRDFLNRNVSENYQKVLRYFIIIFCSYMMATSLYWTVASCINEVAYSYSPGRNEAAFIKEHHLEQYNIWCDWTRNTAGDGQRLNDANMSYFAYAMLPYFKDNIFSTSSYGTDGTYILHVLPTEEAFEKEVELWKEKGYPDVLIGDINLSNMYDPEELSGRDYIFVYYEWAGKIWKADKEYGLSLIRVRRDLAEKLGLQEVVPR